MRIPLAARLIASKAEVKRALANYPNLSLVKEGQELRYFSNFEDDRFYAFRFSSESVVEEIYSVSSPIYLLKAAILRLLGLLCALDGMYDFRIESIFPYLILAINQETSIPKFLPELEQNPGNPEIILAKRILELLKERSEMGKESKALKFRADLLLSHLLLFESTTGKISEDEFSLRYRLGGGDIRRAIEASQSLGYKVLRYGGKEFRVVKP